MKQKKFDSIKTLKRMGLIPRTKHYEQMKVFSIVALVILAFMGLVYLGIKYPNTHLPIEYYMDGPINPMTPHIAVNDIDLYGYGSIYPYMYYNEECVCGNDPECLFPWDNPIQQPKGKYDNYV